MESEAYFRQPFLQQTDSYFTEETFNELDPKIPPWKDANFSERLLLIYLYFSIYLPVFLLLSLLIGGYIIYILFYTVPLVLDTDDRPELYYWHSDSEKRNAKIRGWLFFSLITFFLILCLISHFMATVTDCGSIPPGKEWDIPSGESSDSSSKNPDLVEKRRDGSYRTCTRCQKRKPDRTHHCKQCERCNLKMDHHCNWIANCVGYYNYKYFFLTVLHGSILSLIFISTFWETLIIVLMDSQSSIPYCLFIELTYSLVLMISVCVVSFCCFHVWLIANNYTTIEYCEKKRGGIPEYSVSPFNGGVYHNFQEALGKNPAFWLFPIKYRSNEEKGLHFVRKNEQA
ncbi:unnamed protein product [Blepharisma stoltei]|uniref:Palmitoyltransferase n=1 Tax=Blepharisma stoltei TaxID=1481888 RepID=A0AAU9K5S6_9CILI|nr:unnamed protein product [Blepharisma stoltei]